MNLGSIKNDVFKHLRFFKKGEEIAAGNCKKHFKKLT
jgi:hypothetical protein